MANIKAGTKGKFYITTPIYYPNSDLHLGHAYTNLVTDFYTRWNKLKGKKTFFLTGTDEHGQKVQQAAENINMLPVDFVKMQSEKFKIFFKRLNITNDDFIRTSEQRHEKIASAILKKVWDKGDIYRGEYEGHYCVPCESYWTETQLDEGMCPECKRPTRMLKEPSYFFQMGRYQDKLIKHIEANPDFIMPKTRRNEILSRLKEPLRDLSISRASFDWGIKFPVDETHVIYVWFDALINYVSALGYPDGRLFKEFWPADVHVIGKDILWFHTVIWPCMLMAAGIELPKQVFAHGFIKADSGEKMSKSKGNVVDPVKIIDKYGVEPLRYLLLRNVVAGEDGNFSEKELVERYNNELANDLGNLVMRISKLVQRFCDGKLENSGFKQDLDWKKVFEEADELVSKFEHHRAIDKIWSFINRINAYMNEKEPWKSKDEKQRDAVLYNVLESLRAVTILVQPVLPETSEKICRQLGIKPGAFKDLGFGKTKYSVGEASALFPKIEIEEKGKTFPLDLRVAKIEKVEDHPEAEKLYVVHVNLGKERRQLVAGLKEFYKPGDIIDKNAVVVCNLKKAKLRGVESQGMLLAAEEKSKKDGKLVVGLLLAEKSKPGDAVAPDGMEVEARPNFDIKDFAKLKLVIGEKNRAMFEDSVLRTQKEEIVAEKVGKGAAIH